MVLITSMSCEFLLPTPPNRRWRRPYHRNRRCHPSAASWPLPPRKVLESGGAVHEEFVKFTSMRLPRWSRGMCKRIFPLTERTFRKLLMPSIFNDFDGLRDLLHQRRNCYSAVSACVAATLHKDS